ncbi:MAG: seryl-tRNA synthetase [Parcubacteria group bacterium Athens0714_25]|nr:MAG: seryl-tRNA synthetase [Parcubacteria group bacterium Athens0714_25]
MLDIKFIRENSQELKKAIENKNINLDLDRLLEMDRERVKMMQEIEELQAQKNKINEDMQRAEDKKSVIERGKEVKEKLLRLEPLLEKTQKNFDDMMVKVPNIPSEDTPVGRDEKDNVEIEKSGEILKFDFEPKTHIEIAKDLDIIDFERGAKVAGYRGYYMKNEGASLQMALMMFTLEKLVQKGFAPIIPPTLVKEFVLFGTGYFSGKNFDPEVDEIYKIENIDKNEEGGINKENKFLVGTAEPSLLAYYANEILDESQLPVKFCGFSQCYRSEIGSYGKDTKGLYRVHEFMKVEQVCLTKNNIDDSNKMHLEMVEISKELHRDLGLPYRVLSICTGDMSAGKYKMFDLEAWMPGMNRWGETGSASNFLDWQARRLNVRYKNSEGKKNFVHMINNTAIPSPRIIIAILENYQQQDGSVIIPEALRKWMPNNMEKIEKK